MKLWYEAQYWLRVNFFGRFEYSTIWIVPLLNISYHFSFPKHFVKNSILFWYANVLAAIEFFRRGFEDRYFFRRIEHSTIWIVIVQHIRCMATLLRSLRQITTLRHNQITLRLAPVFRARVVCENSWLGYFKIFDKKLPRVFNLLILSPKLLSQVTIYPKRLAWKRWAKWPNALGQMMLNQVTMHPYMLAPRRNPIIILGCWPKNSTGVNETRFCSARVENSTDFQSIWISNLRPLGREQVESCFSWVHHLYSPSHSSLSVFFSYSWTKCAWGFLGQVKIVLRANTDADESPKLPVSDCGVNKVLKNQSQSTLNTSERTSRTIL